MMPLPDVATDDHMSGVRARKPTSITVGLALGITASGARRKSVDTHPLTRRTPAPRPHKSLTPASPPAPPLTRRVRRAVLPQCHTTNRPTSLTANDWENASAMPTTTTTTSDSTRALCSKDISAVSTRASNATVPTARLVVPTVPKSARKSNWVIVTKGERKRRVELEGPTNVQSRADEAALPLSLAARDAAGFLRLAAMLQPGVDLFRASSPERPTTATSEKTEWTVDRKREAFVRIRDYLTSRLDIGRDAERAALQRYFEADDTYQGLFLLGSAHESTSPLVQGLLERIVLESPDQYDRYRVKGHLHTTPRELYGSIRQQLQLYRNWKLPQWRDVDSSLCDGENLAPVYTLAKSILVIENIDPLVKAVDRSQAPLDRLFRFLNRLVRERGLKLLVIGHRAQTMERFTAHFGGFELQGHRESVLRLPHYTIQTLSAHLEAVAAAALAPMGDTVQLTDVFAKKVIAFAVRKATKAGQCELEPVVRVLQRSLIRMKNQCLHDFTPAYAADPANWTLRYEHVSTVSAKLFQHDFVHRIQCVGTMTQALLLVLIDAGPCTKEELFMHVYDRHLVHVWILIITTFRREKFDNALELLLSVPVVKTRPNRVWRGADWYTETQYYALPTRDNLIEAAGKKTLIKLIP